jgi:hypothetical protein
MRFVFSLCDSNFAVLNFSQFLRKILRAQPSINKNNTMATMDVDEDFPAVAAPVDKSTSSSSKEFDLENYIANYAGHTKIDRLIFIAEHCKDLELEAFKMAIDELKKTTNTVLYKQVTEKVGDRLGAGYRTDQAWIDSVDKRTAQQFEKLEQDLAGYKANLVKESIRVCCPYKFYFLLHITTKIHFLSFYCIIDLILHVRLGIMIWVISIITAVISAMP